jgi:hypothetical protein
VLYGWWDEPIGLPQTTAEPALLIEGDVSVLYAADIRDGEIIEMLEEVAAHLAASLHQQRVYLTYRATAWVLERAEPGPGT